MKYIISILILFFTFSSFGEAEWDNASTPLTHYPKSAPASTAPLLQWTANLNAVSYQIEFFDSLPQNLSNTQLSAAHVYYSANVYTNAYNPPLEKFAIDLIGRKPLYWRVRAVGLKDQPLSLFSVPEPLYTSYTKPRMNAPVPQATYDIGNGTVLLYPVYSWIPLNGAASYEVEILDKAPENSNNALPSQNRIATLTTNICEVYDNAPRFGSQPFYWRVHALDKNGQSIGVYSAAKSIRTDPADNWTVGVFGDSISHGGGHISYGPEDWAFSYPHYLNFPTINLSQSGDTSNDLVNRFEQDVLPFHPTYLIIMGGTNSLREGISAESVINDLNAIKEKCLANHIKPIFLTLLPINPSNIKQAFGEETVADWQAQFARVNDYIRSEVHIDVAAAFNYPDNVLPAELALDGLHPDSNTKKIIGDIINAAWIKTIAEANTQQ